MKKEQSWKYEEHKAKQRRVAQARGEFINNHKEEYWILYDGFKRAGTFPKLPKHSGSYYRAEACKVLKLRYSKEWKERYEQATRP